MIFKFHKNVDPKPVLKLEICCYDANMRIGYSSFQKIEFKSRQVYLVLGIPNEIKLTFCFCGLIEIEQRFFFVLMYSFINKIKNKSL